MTGRGPAGHGLAGLGKAWILNQHAAGHGGAGPGVARHGKAGILNHHKAGRGSASSGLAGLGRARHVEAGQGRGFMTGHTSVRKGKAVIVFLRDGRQVRGYFREQRGRFIVLEDGTKILKSEMRCVTINKQP